MNQKNAPGYGYNPGYEPQPFVCPSVPTNSASIFGLTAHGNNNPPPIQPIPPNEAGGHSQPIYVAQKLNQMNAPQPTQPIQSQTSGVSGDVQQKQIAFLEAKSLIEKIQSGSWTSLPGLCKPGAAFNPDAQNMPGVIDSLAQKPEMAGSPIQRPGVASYQTHRPYFSDSQTNRPGMASSQSQRPGIISSQTHGYGIMSSQTERYGIMSSHTQRPGIMTYQTQGPGIARSQTEIPGIANIQTRIPGIANIQTQIPGIASSQTQIPEIASSQTQIPEIQRSLTQRLCTTNSLTQSPGTVPNQVQIPGIHEDIIQNPLQTESRETMKLDDLGYKGEQKEREHFGREKALEEIDRYRTGRINEVKDVYNRKEDKYVDRLKSSDDKLKKSNDYDKAITGDSFLDEVRRKRMVQDFCRKDGSSEKDVGRKSPTVFDYGHSKNYTVGSLNAYDQDNRYETETRAESQKYREQDSSGKDNYSGRQKPKPADDLYDEVDSYEKMEKYSRSEKDFWGNRDSHRALSYKSETPKENKYEKVVDGRDMDEYKRDRASDLEEKGYSPRDTHDETNTRSPEYINWNDMEYFDKTFDEEMEYTTMDTGHAGATISDERMQSIETKTSQPKDSYERHSMYQSEKNEKEYEIEYRDYERTYELDRDKVEFERKNEIFGLERTTDRGKGKGYTDSFGKERRREKGYERYRKERHTSDEKNSVDSSTGSSEDYRNVREEDRSAYRQRERNEERYNRYQRDRKEQRPRESSGKRHDEDRYRNKRIDSSEGQRRREQRRRYSNYGAEREKDSGKDRRFSSSDKGDNQSRQYSPVSDKEERAQRSDKAVVRKRSETGERQQRWDQTQGQKRKETGSEMYEDFLFGPGGELDEMEEGEVPVDDGLPGERRGGARQKREETATSTVTSTDTTVGDVIQKDTQPKPVPHPAFFCLDCNLSCKDQTGYDNHLKSDLHLLTLQKRAQELFCISARPSRFQTDGFGNPLKATVLPTTLITGINVNSSLTSMAGGLATGRNVFRGEENADIDDTPMPAQFTSNRVQVIPPKPLGPLEARSVQTTWLILYWRARTDIEEQMIDKYVVEYRNAREVRWARVGQTPKHEYEVNGLQEGTDYLFRVYTMNGVEKSDMLESVLITTKKPRVSPERSSHGPVHRGREIAPRSRPFEKSHDRSHDRSRFRPGDLRRDRSRDYTKGHHRSGDRGNRSRSRTRSRSRSRSRGKNRSKERGRPHSGGERPKSGDRAKANDRDKKLTSTNEKKSEETKQEMKIKVEGEKKDNEPKENQTEEKKEEQEDEQDVECLLYRQFDLAGDSPLLGLDEIYEFQKYNSRQPQHYVCKLCNNKGSDKVIMRHIMGYPHKMAFFKKHYPDLYSVIQMAPLRRKQTERMNFEGRKIEDEAGRGAVKVLKMLNPEDNEGKQKFSKPVSVPAPLPEREKQEDIPPVEACEYISQFDNLLQAAKDGGLKDSTLIGLSYIKELFHPTNEEAPKYSCALCKCLCGDNTIIYHLIGKKHRMQYLKCHHEELFKQFTANQRLVVQELPKKIRDLSDKDGPGEMTSKTAGSAKMWRHSKKKETEKIPDSTQVLDESARAEISEEEHVKKDEEEEENEEYSGELTPPQDGEPTPLVTQDNKPAPGSGLPAIKFGIKKTEAAPTPVKPINVLDLSPVKKGGFDWSEENSALQAKIKNQSIIKSSRNSKFITVYSGFFKKFPVIGLQWVSEFQKPDPKHEPWYMCFMCQQKLQWKNILDHVTSNIHRLNYMNKNDYRDKYNAVYDAIKTDKAKAKSLIERFCKDIADTEGPQNVEVMLELNVNTEAFKGVSKIQENIKAHTATTSSALVSNTDAITTPTTTVAQAVQPFGGASTLVPSFPLPQQASGFPAQQLVPSIPPQLANMAPRNVLVPSMPMATSLPDFSIPPPGFPRFPNVSGPPPLLLPPAPSVSMFQITPPPQGQSPAQIAPNLRPTMAPNQPSHSPFGPNFSQSIPNVPFSTTVSHNPSVSQISNMKIPPPAVSISQAIVYPLSSQSVHASQSNVSLAAVPMSVSTPFSKQHPWQTSLPQLTATLIASSLPTAASGSENKIGEIACPSYQLEKTSSENYKARTATDEQYASGYSATTHESYDPEEPGFDRGDKRKYGELDDLNVVTGRSDRIVALKKERYSRSPSGSRETEEFRRVRLRSRSPDSRYNRSKDQRSFSPPRDIYRHHPNESDTYKYSERSYPESSAQYDRELDKDQLDMLLKKYNDREDGFDDFDDFLTNEDSQNKYEPERKVQLRHDRQRIQVNFGPGVSREDIEVPSRADEGSRSKTYDPHGRRERYEDTYEHRRYEHGHSREERSYRSEKLSTDSLERNYEHKAGSLERNGEGYHGRSSSFDREREREKYSFERYRPRGHSREKKEEYVRERTYREDDRLRQGAEGRSDNADKKIRNEPSREEIDELLRQAVSQPESRFAEDVVPDKIEDPRYHQIRLEKDRARPVRLPEDRGQDRWHDREEEERYRDRHADLDGRYRDFPNDRRGGRNLSDKSGRNPDVDWHEERGYDRRAGPDMRSDDTRKDMRSANYY
ncbi:uncharacterized protein LOC128236560 isoform X2 [Mya arenaria]|uniref:uncharacterized protein LOC128236560 isoform X2 n=1 Tax=Mya arenaria TaxID=6604 RepID=UPI0022E71996|nr:uncharacterized protein LOC128236560 isoform X2 [Mya arenaria]